MGGGRIARESGMADDKRKAPGTADGARRRQPPTIDLTAKDITGEAATERTGAATEAPTVDTSQAEPPKPEQPKAEPPEPEQPEAGSPPPPDRKPALVPMLLASAGGGVIVAAVAAALMLSGALTPRSSGESNGNNNNNNDTLVARLDALDSKVSEAANRPRATDNTTSNNAAIAARLDKIEQVLAKPSAATAAGAEKLGAIDGNLKTLGTAIAGLNRRVDEIAANAAAAREQAGAAAKTASELRQTMNEAQPAGRADLDAIGKRLDAVEAAAKAGTQTNAQASSMGAAVRLALAASALREAVNAGRGYATELDAVKAAGGEGGTVTALAPFAAKGLPSDATLAKGLLALVPAISKAAGVDTHASGGFLEKLQANAEKLVRVRPVDGPAGNDAGAVIARIEAHAARNDVAAARAEVERLPPAAMQAAAPWLKAVAARDAARDAARSLATASMRALTAQ
jgi:hypothetical protein